MKKHTILMMLVASLISLDVDAYVINPGESVSMEYDFTSSFSGSDELYLLSATIRFGNVQSLEEFNPTGDWMYATVDSSSTNYWNRRGLGWPSISISNIYTKLQPGIFNGVFTLTSSNAVFDITAVQLTGLAKSNGYIVGSIIDLNLPKASVPEPSSAILLVTAALMIGIIKKYRKFVD